MGPENVEDGRGPKGVVRWGGAWEVATAPAGVASVGAAAGGGDGCCFRWLSRFGLGVGMSSGMAVVGPGTAAKLIVGPTVAAAAVVTAKAAPPSSGAGR